MFSGNVADLMKLLRLLPLALLLAGCTVELQHDLSEDDANDIYVLLQKNGCDPKKLKEEGAEGKYVISVPKAMVKQAAELLRANSLPRPQADGLHIFAKMKGMIPTATEERAMFVEALGGEVSNSLNHVPGVLEARTIVMIPESNDLTQPDKKPLPSASVFIKYRSGPDGSAPLTDAQIKEFVATAVPEMRKESVTVLQKQAAVVEAEAGAESALTDVLGFQVARASADALRGLLASGAIAMLVMAGLTVFAFMRKPAAPRRTRTSTGTNAGTGEG